MFSRIILLIAVGGGVLAFIGIQEYRVSMGTSTEPEQVSLKALEQGEELKNNHVLITEHIAAYPGAVYEHYEGTGKVNHAHYPIISDDHKFFDELNQLAEKYNGLDSAPDSEFPGIDDFKVLVKTREFKTIDSIPRQLTDETSVQGLVVNLVGGLDSDEKKYFKQAYPKLDLDNVLIVEKGRKPASPFKSLGMIGGGVLLILISAGLFFVGRSQ